MKDSTEQVVENRTVSSTPNRLCGKKRNRKQQFPTIRITASDVDSSSAVKACIIQPVGGELCACYYDVQ